MGTLGAIWGIGGCNLILIWAIVRLSGIAIEGLMFRLAWYHLLSLAAIVLFMLYSEGYKGFQRQFSPRFAARARYLKDHPRVLHVLLAPLFCAAFFHTTPSRKVVVYTLTIGIVVLVVLVRRLDQPWRGIIDLGVVAGLAWGVVATLVECVKAFFSDIPTVSPELPLVAHESAHESP